MIKPRRLVWLAMTVIVPIALLLIAYGMSGYAMNASMSVAMDVEPARAAGVARLWLFLIGSSFVVFFAGVAILWRWRDDA